MFQSYMGSIETKEIVDLLGELIRIESINPAYPGGKKGEGEIGDYVFSYLTELGIRCKKEEVLPGRFNIIGYIEGKDRRGLCLETHMDTMPIENMGIDPFEPIIKDGLMYGRGSCDAKASLAAMMYALKVLVKNKIRPSTDIYIIAAIDEEYKYRGVTRFLSKEFKALGAIIGEPTQLNVVSACNLSSQNLYN